MFNVAFMLRNIALCTRIMGALRLVFWLFSKKINFSKKGLTKAKASCIIVTFSREWRNWQTRTFEGRVDFPYGFKSRLSHQKKDRWTIVRRSFFVRETLRETRNLKIRFRVPRRLASIVVSRANHRFACDTPCFARARRQKQFLTVFASLTRLSHRCTLNAEKW